MIMSHVIYLTKCSNFLESAQVIFLWIKSTGYCELIGEIQMCLDVKLFL